MYATLHDVTNIKLRASVEMLLYINITKYSIENVKIFFISTKYILCKNKTIRV